LPDGAADRVGLLASLPDGNRSTRESLTLARSLPGAALAATE
jgi:hypothetical protein